MKSTPSNNHTAVNRATSSGVKMYTPDQVASDNNSNKETAEKKPKEIGGRKSGLDPTRYGDWEKGGRCIDF